MATPSDKVIDELIARLEAADTTRTSAPGGWGDAAIATGLRTVPAIAGGLVGGAGGPLGVAAGGFAGSAIGDVLAQLYEQSRGLREEYSPGLTLSEGAIGAIPMGKAAQGVKAALLKGGGMGALLGGGQTVANDLIEGEQVDPSRALIGALLGGALGTGAYRGANRFMPEPGATPPGGMPGVAGHNMRMPPGANVSPSVPGFGRPAPPVEGVIVPPPGPPLGLPAPRGSAPPGPSQGPFPMGASPMGAGAYTLPGRSPMAALGAGPSPAQLPAQAGGPHAMPGFVDAEVAPSLPALPARAGAPFTGPTRAVGGQAPTIEEFPQLADRTSDVLARLRGNPAPSTALDELLATPVAKRTPKEFAGAIRKRGKVKKAQAKNILDSVRARTRTLSPEEAAESAKALKELPAKSDANARKVHKEAVKILEDRAAKPHRVETPDVDKITTGASGNFDLSKFGEDLRRERVILQLHQGDPEAVMTLVSKLVRRAEDRAANRAESVSLRGEDFAAAGLKTPEQRIRFRDLLTSHKSLLHLLDNAFA